MRLLWAALFLLQSPTAPGAPGAPGAPELVGRPELRAGLDTLYGGGFPAAAAHFAALAAEDTTDPAPVSASCAAIRGPR